VATVTHRDELIASVMRQWNAHQEWLGKGYGPDLNTLREMAEVAVMGLTEVRRWTIKDTIPDDAHVVGDECERTWIRVVRRDGSRGWSCFVLESRFPELVGDVYEIPDWRGQERRELAPPRCAAHGDAGCTWCAQTAPGGLEGGRCLGCDVYAETGMHWDTCPHRIPTAPPHKDPPNTTVALDNDAVAGLVALLESVAVKLTRVHNAYKGPAIKHADTMADQCTQTATLLRDVLGTETGDSDE